jgi:hypothetical protein
MSQFLSQNQQEKLLRKELAGYFIKKGFFYSHDYLNSHFRLFHENKLYQFEVQATSHGLVYTKHLICFFEGYIRLSVSVRMYYSL